MLLKSGILVLICALTSMAASIEFPERSDWRGAKNLIELDDDVLELQSGIIVSTDIFKVDPGKKAVLSGEFRTLPGKKVRVYIGYICLDGAEEVIAVQHVNLIADSETELTAPVARDDASIYVRDGSKFAKGSVVAFDAKADLSDLPNRNLSQGRIGKAEQQADGTWLIPLDGKAGYDYPAGGKVRAHMGGGYLYSSIVDLNENWKTVQGSMTGMALKIGGRKWWPGTKSARLIIFGASESNPIFFRNLTLTEEE